MTASGKRLPLTLLSRQDCPLCDEFRLALEAWKAGRGLVELSVVDVDGDAALARRFGWDVPVLLHGSEQLCSGHFEPASVARLVGGAD